MDKESLVLEVHYEGQWHPAFELEVIEPDAGTRSRTRSGYLYDFVLEHIDDLGTRDQRTVAERYPLGLDAWSRDEWPAFALDIMPSGAARTWWRDRLADRDLTENQLDFVLLRDHTIAPIGHLRISAPQRDGATTHDGFAKSDVIERATGFLEYAADQGAAVGGATGAGGDAPKLLLAEDADGLVYPDAALGDDATAACWFVKWPRGRDTDRDRIVLRTEHQYAHALAELGFDTCPGDIVESDSGKPCLWLPRFDRVVGDGRVERLAVESFYSLAGISRRGATITHQRYLQTLASALEARGQSDDLPGMVAEYVERELLDVILGNSDNHGRNRAVVRGQSLRFAPIYDLAPMVLDPSGVTRSSRWGEHEKGGRIHWPGVMENLGEWVDSDELLARLREFAERIRPLPDMLRDAGIHESVMNHHRVYLRNLDEKFEEWGLR